MDGTWSRCGDIPNAAPTPFGHIVHENVLALVVLWTNLIFYRMYLIGTNLFSSIMCCAWQKKGSYILSKYWPLIFHMDTLWSLFIFIYQCPLSCMLVNFFSWWHPYGCGLLICWCPIWIHLLLMCLSLEMLFCSRCWIIACFCLLEESIANFLFDIILWGVVKALFCL